MITRVNSLSNNYNNYNNNFKGTVSKEFVNRILELRDRKIQAHVSYKTEQLQVVKISELKKIVNKAKEVIDKFSNYMKNFSESIELTYVDRGRDSKNGFFDFDKNCYFGLKDTDFTDNEVFYKHHDAWYFINLWDDDLLERCLDSFTYSQVRMLLPYYKYVESHINKIFDNAKINDKIIDQNGINEINKLIEKLKKFTIFGRKYTGINEYSSISYDTYLDKVKKLESTINDKIKNTNEIIGKNIAEKIRRETIGPQVQQKNNKILDEFMKNLEPKTK